MWRKIGLLPRKTKNKENTWVRSMSGNRREMANDDNTLRVITNFSNPIFKILGASKKLWIAILIIHIF